MWKALNIIHSKEYVRVLLEPLPSKFFVWAVECFYVSTRPDQ